MLKRTPTERGGAQLTASWIVGQSPTLESADTVTLVARLQSIRQTAEATAKLPQASRAVIMFVRWATTVMTDDVVNVNVN